MEKTKSYFISDIHLGAPNYESSREREKKVVAWLDSISADAKEIFLMGDIFDFWFEYATVIPKGFIRLQGKLAQLSDAGTKLYFFKGNHDMWVFDYFKKEFGLEVISDELIIERFGKKYFLHHGDGLGSGDVSYKLLKNFFRSGFCQWLFARIHPNLGIGIANAWSSRSRIANNNNGWTSTMENEKKWVTPLISDLKVQFGEFSCLVMGHRHTAYHFNVDEKTAYLNLGEWVNHSNYAVLDETGLQLKSFNYK